MCCGVKPASTHIGRVGRHQVAAAASTFPAMASYQVGIDFGSDDSVVSVAPPATTDDGTAAAGAGAGATSAAAARAAAPLATHMAPVIARNNLSNHSTPTIVSFSGRRRIVGEEARDNFRVNAKNCVTDLPELLGRSAAAFADATGGWHTFALADLDGGGTAANVQFNGRETAIRPEHAASMVLKALVGFADRDIPDNSAARTYTIAVPPSFSASQRQSLRDAAKLAGIGSASVVPSTRACAAVWAAKHHASLPEAGEPPVHVAFVDVGHTFASVAVAAFTKGSVTELHAESKPLGAGLIDKALFEHCAKVCKERHGVELKKGTKQAIRALMACAKTKKVLSTVGDSKIDLENVAPDVDVSVDVTQAQLREMCAAHLEQLRTMLADAMFAATSGGAGEYRAVEVVGGGTRIPAVKEIIVDVFGDKLAYTLDSAHAVSCGAATIGARMEAKAILEANAKRAADEAEGQKVLAAAAAEAEAAAVKAAEAAEAEAKAKAVAEAAATGGEGDADNQAEGDDGGDGGGDDSASGAAGATTTAAAPAPVAAAPPAAANPELLRLRRAAAEATAAAARAADAAAEAQAEYDAAVAAAAGLDVAADSSSGGGDDAASGAGAGAGAAGAPLDDGTLAAITALETSIAAQADALAAAASARYEFQSYMYEMRGAQDGEHGSHLPEDTAGAILADAEAFSMSTGDRMEELEYSDAPDDEIVASLRTLTEEFKAKRSEVEAALREKCAGYFEALATAQAAVEAELTKASAAREAEEAADEAAGNVDDHDRRKLRTGERLRLLVKNKEEGNELFRDGNHQAAAMRYIKALNHATKFFDLKDGEQEEVDAAKLSCYLNLAMCYIKLEQYNKALENCKSALFIQPDNVKALFRAAMSAEKLKDIGAAEEYTNKAKALAPDDKQVLKIDKRIQAVRAKQKAKEKKMAQRMFG